MVMCCFAGSIERADEGGEDGRAKLFFFKNKRDESHRIAVLLIATEGILLIVAEEMRNICHVRHCVFMTAIFLVHIGVASC